MRVTTTSVSILAALLALCACDFGPESEACDKYVDCVAHAGEVFNVNTAGIEDAYGEGGTCWMNEETFDACDIRCSIETTEFSTELRNAGEDLGPCE